MKLQVLSELVPPYSELILLHQNYEEAIEDHSLLPSFSDMKRSEEENESVTNPCPDAADWEAFRDLIFSFKRSLAPEEIFQLLKNKLEAIQFQLESPLPTLDGLYHFFSTRLHIMEEIEAENVVTNRKESLPVH